MPDAVHAKRLAHLAGFLYLLIIAGGLFAEAYARGALISADPLASARNIVAQEGLFRAALVVSLLFVACNYPFALAVHEIFKPAGRRLTLLATFLLLGAATVEMGNLINHAAPLNILIGERYAFLGQEHRAALAALEMAKFNDGFAVSLMVFALYFFCLGALMLRARFLPKILGVMGLIAGAAYFSNSMLFFIAPDVQPNVFVYLMAPCFIAELSLALWLALRGFDKAKWEAQALGA